MVAKLQDFEASDLPAPSKAALRFMDAWMLGHAQDIDDAFFAELRVHFSPRQLVELTSLAGIYESVHKFNHLFELPASEGIVGFGPAQPPAALSAYVETMKRGRSG